VNIKTPYHVTASFRGLAAILEDDIRLRGRRIQDHNSAKPSCLPTTRRDLVRRRPFLCLSFIPYFRPCGIAFESGNYAESRRRLSHAQTRVHGAFRLSA